LPDGRILLAQNHLAQEWQVGEDRQALLVMQARHHHELI
jgi:hypothetical protein